MVASRDRRTKIVCTLGPATSSRKAIKALIGAGMDVARLNFSHGTHSDHEKLINIVREEARAAGKRVPILQDLQGPKIRIGTMKKGGVLLRKGDSLVLTSEPMEKGTKKKVYVSYPALAREVQVGGRILVDDGHIELEIADVKQGEVQTEVIVGGVLRSRKGVNLPAIRTSSPSLTEKDLKDLEFGLSHDVDFVALSFVRSGDDVEALLERIEASGKNVGVIAKIEKPEAVTDFDAILSRSDAIMVARGDLGIEIPMQEVPVVQKQLIRKCLQAAKPCITATQMLDSMIENPRPTRAEASDVANAVLDGSDAVMLSGETASGKHPIRAVEVMDEIVRSVENQRRRLGGQEATNEPDQTDAQITQAISYTAVRLAEEVDAKALCCLTHSGATAKAIASHRPEVPIFAFTEDEKVASRMSLLWGTRGLLIQNQNYTDMAVKAVHAKLLEYDLAELGERIVVTAGLPLPAKGLTNMVHVGTLGDNWEAVSAQ
ncbi:MAG: pyruvate kinase [Rubricoccaceae bacterium]|nr:pyruvate kinase [Rubricoccaceae bacterium]